MNKKIIIFINLFFFFQSPIAFSKEKEVLVSDVEKSLNNQEKKQGSIKFIQGEVSNKDAALYIKKNMLLFSNGYVAPTNELKEIEKIALEKIYKKNSKGE